MKEEKWNDVIKIKSIRNMLEMSVESAGDIVAIKYKDESGNVIDKTYKKFYEDINSLGTAITKLGLGNKHVAIIGNNSYKWLTTYLMMIETEGVFVPLDKEMNLKGIINNLKHSESEALFYSEKYEGMIEEISKEIPNIKYFIGLDLKEDDGRKKLSYDKLIENGRKALKEGNKDFLNLHDDENNLKMLVYTSGTTGDPKGVMLTEHNLISVVNYGLMVADIKTRCLSVLPYHHTYEAVAGILVALHHRSTICINDSLKNVLKNLQLYKPDYIYLVPAFTEIFYKTIWSKARKEGKANGLKFLISLSNFLRKFGIDLRKKFFKSIYDAFGGNLEEIVCGGAPIRPDVGKFFNDIGIVLLNGYGITECSPLVSVNRFQNNDSSTVGIVLPCCEIKFENVNEEGDGEICVKGDIVMMGYYKDKERTDRVLKDGWFNTEDFGHLNEKNQLCINGRKKNLIVLNNGKNVYPEEIENYILQIPYVKEAIVKSEKNELGQEVSLTAEVFLNEDDVKEMNVEDIHEKLKLDIRETCKTLPIYKKVSKIEIRDNEFKKTTTNKIIR